ncbi:MAG: hypothetical protein ACJAT7_001378 [Psychromonas sp.]|jgi:hypothetical protein|uniref:hypothetical protein n=1 Tax=Psychromonas sp. TaxID=1884585 RepID=UPI0039E230B4
MDNYFLIKFGAFEHMKLLLDTGEIYMDVLSSYRKNEYNEQRHDPHDGIERMMQLKGAQLSTKNKETGISEVVGTFNDGLGIITNNNIDNLNVFCIYHLPINVSEEVTLGDSIDNQVLTGFGNTAVFINDSETFLSRIKDSAIMHGYKFIPSLVKYVDIKERHDEVGPFIKDLEFSHQQELRIGVFNSDSGSMPIKLMIGNISDIATLVSTEDLSKWTSKPFYK